MQEKEIKIRDSFIRLGQAMKLAGISASGLEAKEEILNGNVRVNGEVEMRRGRKLVPGDSFTFQDYRVKVGQSDVR